MKNLQKNLQNSTLRFSARFIL